jgi:hypothetical protein
MVGSFIGGLLLYMSNFCCLPGNRSSLEPSLGFAAIAGTPRIEIGGPLLLILRMEGRTE